MVQNLDYEIIVSVIMPVYNGESYLPEAIESVLNQTYCKFEFLIINDGSTDRSEEIILSYNDPRIVYLKNDKNRGLVYTLNYGIRQSKGIYIARMDADDICIKTRFEQQIEAFNKDTELGLCGSWAKIIGSGNILRVAAEYESIKCRLLFTNQFIHSSVMIRKEKLLSFSDCYNDSDFPAEDYGLWCKLSPNIKMINLNTSLVEYRIHSSQISTAASAKQLKKTNEIRLNQLEIFFNYKPTPEEENIHLLFLNNTYKIASYKDLNNIGKWISKLKDLSLKCGYYNQSIFEKSINEYLSHRFISQNIQNNNPIFLIKFYLFYFKNKCKFDLAFHLKYIAKCLIFYSKK